MHQIVAISLYNEQFEQNYFSPNHYLLEYSLFIDVHYARCLFFFLKKKKNDRDNNRGCKKKTYSSLLHSSN